MKNKLKKIGLWIGAPATLILAMTTISCEYNDIFNQNIGNNELEANGNSEFKYEFKGRYYDSLDDITNELINNNPYINTELYYGDAAGSVFDHESNRLTISKLRKFDKNKTAPVYINALGQPVRSFEDAKKSFVNPAFVKYRYQDTKGVLYNTESEATRAILDGVKVDETVYYQIKDEKNKQNVKINPLNAQDIAVMKKIAFENTEYNLQNSNSGSKFGIIPMANKVSQGIETSESFELGQGILSSLFNQNLNSIYTNLFNPNEIESNTGSFTNILRESIKESINENTFDVKVDFKYFSTVSEKNNYLAYDIFEIKDGKESQVNVFDNIIIKRQVIPNQLNSPNGKQRIESLTFKNIKYQDLELFNVFLNTNNWKTMIDPAGNIVSVKGTTDGNGIDNISTRMTFTNFFGRNFYLKSVGQNFGAPIGVNTEILNVGALDKNELYFNFNFSLSNNQGNFKKSVESNVIENWNKPEDQRILKEIFDVYTPAVEKVNSIIEKQEYVRNAKNRDGTATIEKIKSLDVLVNGVVNGEVNLGILLPTENDQESKILNIFLNEYRQVDIFLTYDNVPIFKLTDYLNYDEGIFDKSINKSRNFYSHFLNVLKSKQKNNYDLKSNIFNISNNISFSQNAKTFIYSERNNSIAIPPIEGDNPHYFTDKNTNNYSIYQGQLNKIASNNPPSYISNSFKYALSSYNDNLREIYSENNNKLPEKYNKNIVKNSSDILYLRRLNAANQLSERETYYGEFISLLDYFNESLSDEMKTILYDELTLETLKQTSNLIDPAKVIVVYDFLGNVINPGIVLDKDLASQTTSDAMYDSERMILDNIYRTFIVKKDLSKIFYKNEDETYTLLENKVNFVYQLKYDQKTHYFLTHHDAWLYLREIIALEAQKVNIKGVKNEGK